MLSTGGSAFRECWDGGSYCHGWSATPSRDLLVHTLGVTPAEPGYGRVRVAPRLGTLSGARGKVPTPHGPVRADATPDRVRVTSPVPVEVLHPDGSLTHHPSGSSAVALAGPAPRKD
ncbi:alpha-L-rhamnosidase C-terminal domain-containing protein [Streptomyces sp. NPDC057545]|uniref:alpha-L-rhamnosidase C-terminal domain-containing protein n=1 Tax=Streptomyces sp. NPDC057545 TaxID=3346164 RepID=UPI003683D206